MPKPLTRRRMTEEEAAAIQRVAQSRTAPARAVERARIIWLAHQGHHAPASAAARRLPVATVRCGLRRFHAAGLAGLGDGGRSGRPPTDTPAPIGEVGATSRTEPPALGQPVGSWPLDRLPTYRTAVTGIPIPRSRIGELVPREGVRGRTQETGCGDRVDPAFAEQRGAS